MRFHEPRVSVLVPAYNVGPYIAFTLDSLCRQTYPHFEVLVIDDGSSDDTLEKVERFADSRIHLVRHAQNMGLAAARNTGIAHARGEFIALLDSDDIALPDRLKMQVDALDADRSLMMVGSHVSVIRENGANTDIVWRRPTNPDMASIQLLFRNTMSAVMMFRRNAIPEGGYRSLPMAEDYDFNVRLAARGKICNVDKVLTQVRVRAGGLTQSKQALMERCVRDIMDEQIRRLGIEPRERELALNRHVGAYTLPNDVALLRDVEAWLLKLARANAKTNRYPDSAFRHVLGREWYEVCKFASSLGPDALRTWRASPLSADWLPPFAERAKFITKCLLRHARQGGDVAALEVR